MERLEGMFREEVRPTKEVSEYAKRKAEKEKRDQIIEASRMDRRPPEQRDVNTALSGLECTIVDEAKGILGVESIKKVTALGLEEFYKDHDKDDKGFVTIMCYDGVKGFNYYVSALKAMYNILKGGRKDEIVRLNSAVIKDVQWNMGACINKPGMRFVSGVVHMKKQITMSTHHDYLFEFGTNECGQRYVSYRIITRIPNDKVFFN